MIERDLNVQPDPPDLRDRMYEPTLERLAPQVDPDVDPDHILDQGSEGACTGFALAAAINQLRRAGGERGSVSPRMLYEMARRFDEWEGEDYTGSSVRGAIRGWKNSGVCLHSTWPYREDRIGNLTIRRAKEARSCTVGAYYRIRPEIADVHAAIHEAGVIVVSAQVHAGWDWPDRVIPFHDRPQGGHAFAVVGYDSEGFWVQNSWGPEWGRGGLAVWTYEDWAHNVMDAWVVQLALPTPQIFGVKPQAAIKAEKSTREKTRVPRAEIAGHFVHVDDGRFKEHGRYWSTNGDVRQTAALVARSPKYDHLLMYAHGGLNSPDDSARRVRAMRDVFKRNGIYPYHVMYDTGLVEELKDVILRRGQQAEARVGGLPDWLDRTIEKTTRRFGTRLWDEMKNDARIAFRPGGAGTHSLQHFIRELRKDDALPTTIHLVGHSTGGVLIGHLLTALANESIRIDTCTLFAPACTVDFYEKHYLPVLRGDTTIDLAALQILNLTDDLEQQDEVLKIYNKSLLYLVSNAFERLDEGQECMPLLGMETYSRDIDTVAGKARVFYSDGSSGRVSHSRTHGGFDNDVTSMNFVLRTILGRLPDRRLRFKADELMY